MVAFAGHYDFDIDVRRSPRTGGRVYSYDAPGSFVAIPLAQATVGPLSAAIGVHTTLLGAAVVMHRRHARGARRPRAADQDRKSGHRSAPVSAAA
ncbi:hypothetical protein [Streptomyces sp. NPDC058613]|uniref:hypothetical protein n=1 Tax=unclassified Streptomyces TaxID=2593676 RepID=UPI003666AC4E